jgi:hypothetical protein
MAVAHEPVAHDPSVALALDSLGLPVHETWEGYTPLPARVMQWIIGASGVITALVWLIGLRAR